MIDNGHRLIENQFRPVEIKYDGNTWPGISGQVEAVRGSRRPGGQFREATSSVSIRACVVGDVRISSGKPITVDGIPYFVGIIRFDSGAWEVECVADNSNV